MNQQQKKFTLNKAFSLILKKASLIQHESSVRRDKVRESRKYTTKDVVDAFKNRVIAFKEPQSRIVVLRIYLT